MIPKDLLEAFHLDTQFKNQMMALIEGWATQIVENVNYVAEEEKRELIKDYMNGERNEILKNLEDKDKDLDEYLKDKKELYDNLQEEVNY